MIDYDALMNITYGLYIVCAGDQSKGNGFISNAVFQVTSEPPQFAVCCNKNNFSCDMIASSGAFSVSVLNQEVDPELIKRFGYQSGRDVDKFAGMDVQRGKGGIPIVMNDAIAYMTCSVVQRIDIGTHILFVGQVTEACMIKQDCIPLTYAHYRRVFKGVAPKNAPTYIDKSKLQPEVLKQQHDEYICNVCGYSYDESNETVPFQDLPEDWVCPVCGADKTEFEKQ